MQIDRADILQGLRDFHDFERVADGVAERLIHVRDQRLDSLVAHAAADTDHHLRKPAGFHLLLHECACADLDVENQRIETDGELLRHDGRSDQRNGFDGAGGIAQGIELSDPPERSRRSGR